ncbi:uncharacterized protein LOC143891853 [Tasmannia lanceolata]|uniref:uncharacterized protein LOC143891853 n=1 Tax=Tasmannia lanceolata TaxID=3420 RepID=UPI0040634B5B
MTTTSPESDNTASLCPVDLWFDLDQALTPAENSGRIPSPESLVTGMPAVFISGFCTVCMEELKSGKRTPCCHVYHATCILNWLALSDFCPLCRSLIRPEY